MIEPKRISKAKTPAQGTVICGFPGVGKTCALKALGQQALKLGRPLGWVVDHDTRGYDTDVDFPVRYVQDLEALVRNGHQVMTSTRPEVLDALTNTALVLILVYPQLNSDDEYLNRYLSRHMDIKSVRYLYGNWKRLIKHCWTTPAKTHKELKPGQTFLDVVHVTAAGLTVV